MKIEYKKFIEILEKTNNNLKENKVNESDVIEKIKEELQKEYPSVYEKWENDKTDGNGFHINQLFEHNNQKYTLLHWADIKGHVEVVNALIENGADV